MPRFRKLSGAETSAQDQPSPGSRAIWAREYDTYVASFAIGDYGRAELHDGERRDVVRTRLHAAACRRGLALRFRPGPGAAMIFYVVAAPVVAPTLVPAANQRRDEAARRDPTPRSSLRWMREGGQEGRRAGSKRRHGR